MEIVNVHWFRIETVMKHTGLTTMALARKIRHPRVEQFYMIKRGEADISEELAAAIHRHLPQISKSWLLTGHGRMFLPEPPSMPF